MSLAGLGLSLGHSAQAKSDPAVRPSGTVLPGLEGLGADGDAASSASAVLDPASIPDGPLDVTLSGEDTPASLSEDDRTAAALAMVLMAEPTPAPLGPMFAPVALSRESSAEFLRHFGDAPSPRQSLAAAKAIDRAIDPSSNAPVALPGAERGVDSLPATMASRFSQQDLEALQAFAGVDVDLGAEAETLPAPRTSVDVNLELSPVLDLNLDLGAGLDLNLDIAPEVDLRLDRPPVFAATRLKPPGSAIRAARARPGETPGRACTAADTIVAMSHASKATPALTHAPAPGLVSEPARAPPPNAAPDGAEAAVKLAPTIVVASHADRVLRSLEVLVTNDEPIATRFGARPQEVFVTSHAEKALLALASTCAGEQAPPAADQTPRISKVDPGPPATRCQPMVKSAPAARPAAIGIDAMALSQGDLDKVRGGFETPGGLKISFGIERAVYINGSLVTTTSLNVSDLGKVTGGGTGALASAVAGSGNLTLIQNGPGNTFVTGPVSAATVGTIVQNTLNDQKIQNVTAINATVNSLQVVRAQNLQSTLRGALIDSLRR